MTLSSDERRALAIIAALLVLAGAARWLERPEPLLADVDAVDVAQLQAESRAAQDGASGRGGGSGTADRGGKRPAAKIDPNTATAAELDRLPGVGASLAGRIIEERERGRFRTLGDLTRVRGVGPALATRWADLVTLPAGPATPAETPNSAVTPVETAAGPGAVRAPGARLHLNEISSDDLQKVPGVGPVLARRLIERRDSLGGFRRWDQVDEVAGVGPAILVRLKEWLVLPQQ